MHEKLAGICVSEAVDLQGHLASHRRHDLLRTSHNKVFM